MRKLFIFCFLLPVLSSAQSFSKQGNTALSENITAIHGTEWQTLLRPNLQKPVSAFYRFSYNDDQFRLELKIAAGGAPFVVAKNAELELLPEGAHAIFLYNEQYESSCRGCGSRSVNKDVPGVTLTFVLDKHSINVLSDNYLHHITLHLTDNDLGGVLSLRRSETFREELVHFVACH